MPKESSTKSDWMLEKWAEANGYLDDPQPSVNVKVEEKAQRCKHGIPIDHPCSGCDEERTAELEYAYELKEPEDVEKMREQSDPCDLCGNPEAHWIPGGIFLCNACDKATNPNVKKDVAKCPDCLCPECGFPMEYCECAPKAEATDDDENGDTIKCPQCDNPYATTDLKTGESYCPECQNHWNDLDESGKTEASKEYAGTCTRCGSDNTKKTKAQTGGIIGLCNDCGETWKLKETEGPEQKGGEIPLSKAGKPGEVSKVSKPVKQPLQPESSPTRESPMKGDEGRWDKPTETKDLSCPLCTRFKQLISQYPETLPPGLESEYQLHLKTRHNMMTEEQKKGEGIGGWTFDCPKCGGTGKVGDAECDKCDGTGGVYESGKHYSKDEGKPSVVPFKPIMCSCATCLHDYPEQCEKTQCSCCPGCYQTSYTEEEPDSNNSDKGEGARDQPKAGLMCPECYDDDTELVIHGTDAICPKCGFTMDLIRYNKMRSEEPDPSNPSKELNPNPDLPTPLDGGGSGENDTHDTNDKPSDDDSIHMKPQTYSADGVELPDKVEIPERLYNDLMMMIEYSVSNDNEAGGFLIVAEHGNLGVVGEQFGKDREIVLEPNEALHEGEELIGTVHMHPVTPTASTGDVTGYLNDKNEKVMVVVGADKSINFFFKVPDITAEGDYGDEISDNFEQEDMGTMAEGFGFIWYRGEESDRTELHLMDNVIEDLEFDVLDESWPVENVVKALGIKGRPDIPEEYSTKKTPLRLQIPFTLHCNESRLVG
jgi:proteasome lid subunit RPN8/RPN11